MKVLISIKPEFANMIFDGKKIYEYRKSVWKDKSVRTAVVYASSPVKKVVGEFDISCILCAAPAELWRNTHDFSGIDESFFNEYFYGRNMACAIQIKEARKYKQPFALSKIYIGPAPQSFCYLRE